MVIAAYNEESIIAEKIENTLALTYPGELNIIVFSDASSDRTDEIVRQYSNAGVELIRIEGRVGKTACQNEVVDRLESDVVVFSDANSMYEPDAVRKLVERLESGVACVIGELRYQAGDVEGESLYWRYERMLKQLEDTTGTTIAGNGAIYAIKRHAYIPLANDEISDFAEPLAILQNGGEIAYSPDAIAYESTTGSVESELSRRIRISTRSWHTLWRYRSLLNPISSTEISYKLGSHKLLRWLSPIFLVLILVSTVVLSVLYGGFFFPILVGLQALCYALAVSGFIFESKVESLPLVVHVPYYFLMANYGLLLGLHNFFQKKNITSWETDDKSRQV
ncbi:glycosyltransferase [Natrinema hispanicum]|uniref:glycosyltransferase n=1 Tax=Natrinema hispanicum TaxID=392421 RepID=UPI0020C83935|nr:glycosyltransferase [Natrinema hispanicum]